MIKLKKACGKLIKKLVPFRIYKLIANGAIVVPSYYKGIIADAEKNFDLSIEDSVDKSILMMRKYAHIIDKGLHRDDAEPGHSKAYYTLLKQEVTKIENTKYANDPTVIWAKSKLTAYENLQTGDFQPLHGERPTINVSFDRFEELVKARRSNRTFSTKPVSDESIHKLKQLANWASSSCNKQPIEIYATNDPKLAKECLTCCKGGTGFSEHIPSFWVFSANILGYVWPSEIFLPSVDTCLGVQNVMLGATTLGLSGTILSWAQKSNEEEAKLKSLLNIPAHHQIIICAVMGYAENEFSTPNRKAV
jgi:hypothetical protein